MGILTKGTPNKESDEKVYCFWQGTWNQTFPNISLCFY